MKSIKRRMNNITTHHRTKRSPKTLKRQINKDELVDTMVDGMKHFFHLSAKGNIDLQEVIRKASIEFALESGIDLDKLRRDERTAKFLEKKE